MTTQTPTAQSKNTPDFYIHTVKPNGRTTRIGNTIGVAFKHKNDQGFTLYLDAQPIPVNGQIELVAFRPKS